MADFRKIVVALAVLVFAAGMANAQTFGCSATVAAPPQLRSEGLTELIGDILLDCTGTGPSGLANFTVYAPTNITSRVATDQNSGISEALLLVNEPAAGAAVLAPNDTTPGCTGVGADPAASANACTYNVFQGSVNVVGATPSVTFLGIPVVPPGTQHRIYRITNIRVNANAFAGGTTGVVPLTVQLSISGTTAVPVDQTTFTAGFVTKSMVFDGLVKSNGVDAATALTIQQCMGINASQDTSSSMSVTATTYIQFRELFATAFKPRGTSTQTTAGFSYNTESGLSPSDGSGPVASISAQASWGTRLRATFSNIPLGTEVWVGNFNVELSSQSAVAGSARLHTDTATSSLSTTSNAWRRIVASDATSGTAIWEVVGGSATTLENYDFPVFLKAVPAPQTSPATGVQGTVTGNYAPTPSSSQATAWSRAMSGTIPRFVDPGTTVNLITFVVCRTNLLFPYVLGGVAGFDTGIAITNTSKDPFGTVAQSGTCILNFYGASAPAQPFTTPSIGSATTDFGVIWSSTAMSLAASFNGYIIAQCNFQYGHGFAFVSDIGAHNIAMGYLALILPDVDAVVSGSKVGRPVNGAAAFNTAETLGQ